MSVASFRSYYELDMQGYPAGSYIISVTNTVTGEAEKKVVLKL